MQKIKAKGQAVRKIEWKRTEAIALPSVLTRSVTSDRCRSAVDNTWWWWTWQNVVNTTQQSADDCYLLITFRFQLRAQRDQQLGVRQRVARVRVCVSWDVSCGNWWN